GRIPKLCMLLHVTSYKAVSLALRQQLRLLLKRVIIRSLHFLTRGHTPRPGNRTRVAGVE
ncbi:hypothetical protein L9F63_007040, partial [Diploptera punctata]